MLRERTNLPRKLKISRRIERYSPRNYAAFALRVTLHWWWRRLIFRSLLQFILAFELTKYAVFFYLRLMPIQYSRCTIEEKAFSHSVAGDNFSLVREIRQSFFLSLLWFRRQNVAFARIIPSLSMQHLPRIFASIQLLLSSSWSKYSPWNG